MLSISLRQARAQWSNVVARVEAGETFHLCRRNKPVAEIRPILSQHTGPRPIGLAKGQFTIPANAFESLPEDEWRAFNNPSV